MSAPPNAPPQEQVRDWPVYWFVVLEKAVERGEHQTAAHAQRNLQRLGVEVKYRRAVASQEGRRVS